MLSYIETNYEQNDQNQNNGKKKKIEKFSEKEKNLYSIEYIHVFNN